MLSYLANCVFPLILSQETFSCDQCSCAKIFYWYTIPRKEDKSLNVCYIDLVSLTVKYDVRKWRQSYIALYSKYLLKRVGLHVLILWLLYKLITSKSSKMSTIANWLKFVLVFKSNIGSTFRLHTSSLSQIYLPYNCTRWGNYDINSTLDGETPNLIAAKSCWFTIPMLSCTCKTQQETSNKCGMYDFRGVENYRIQNYMTKIITPKVTHKLPGNRRNPGFLVTK